MIYLKSLFVGLLTAIVGSVVAIYVALAILSHKMQHYSGSATFGLNVVGAAQYPIAWVVVLSLFLAGFVSSILVLRKRTSQRS